MRLSGRIVKDTKIIKEALVENNEDTLSFRDKLEECLIRLCKELDIQVPLWLKKNTSEFVTYQKTSFNGEQFVETVRFDRFDIRLDQS